MIQSALFQALNSLGDVGKVGEFRLKLTKAVFLRFCLIAEGFYNSFLPLFYAVADIPGVPFPACSTHLLVA